MTDTRNKPGGRPAKSRIDKQRRVVSTKLTELQYYAVRKRAGEAGMRVSEYVRQAVVSAQVTPRLNRQDADTLRKLAGEANNINQLAHRANAGGFALVAVELVKLKNRIGEIISHLSDKQAGHCPQLPRASLHEPALGQTRRAHRAELFGSRRAPADGRENGATGAGIHT